MSINRLNLPAGVERAVRKNSYYGCICCGCPIVEYHHIIPYHIVQEHTEENMVALCANCHRDVHNKVISDRQLRKAIEDPYNKRNSFVSHQFSLANPLKSYIDVTGNKCFNTRVILRVGNTDIIWFELDQQNELLLNAKLYNALGILCVQIINNRWFAMIDDDTWDITYKAGELVIKSSRNRIDIRLKINNDVVFFEGEMLIQGKRFVAKNHRIVLGDKQCIMTGGSFVNCGCAIWIDGENILIGCN